MKWVYNREDWNKKFAWFPVSVGNHTTCWLEFVEARYVKVKLPASVVYYGIWFDYWEYRVLKGQ